jgi:Zn-dependent protease with chaperone function
MDELVDASRASFAPGPISPLYRVGLILVAVAMILLPIIYVALIVLAASGILWHLQNDTWLLGQEGSALIRAGLYVAPVVAGGILIVFMIKPLFAKPAAQADRVTLDPEDHRLLFNLIDRICTSIGAPAPMRVQVDCSVNAAASLADGPFKLIRPQLVLTIGLPLAAGLTAQQFAGVLAHEFGHFAQGAGLRFSYAIGSINRWFWRVVNERDEWDTWLDASARQADVRLGVMLQLGRGAVWCTRRVLWVLMMCGHFLSSFMLRQMEYDADVCAVKVVGTDAFGQMLPRLMELDVAAQFAYGDMQKCWATRRLPNDFAQLVAIKCTTLPRNFWDRIHQSADSVKGNFFDTHPSQKQRLEAARRLVEPGILVSGDRASTLLFEDFEKLSQIVTRHHYERLLGLRLDDVQFINTAQLLDEGQTAAAADLALKRLFADNVVDALRPIPFDAAAIRGPSDPVAAWEALANARAAMDHVSSRTMAWRTQSGALEERKTRAAAARTLIEAGYLVQGEAFGLSEGTTKSADDALARVSREQDAVDRELTSYEQHVGLCIAAACHLVHTSDGDGALADDSSRDHVSKMVDALDVLNRTHGAVVRLQRKIAVFDEVAAYARTHGGGERLNPYAVGFAAGVQKLVKEVRQSVSGLSYPFEPAGSSLTTLAYLRGPDVTREDFSAELRDARSHVDLFLQMYWRVVGELALCVERVETMSPRR